jgi:hypothetical protein
MFSIGGKEALPVVGAEYTTNFRNKKAPRMGPGSKGEEKQLQTTAEKP